MEDRTVVAHGCRQTKKLICDMEGMLMCPPSWRGREPPDAMSLPELLGRLSLRFADVLRNTSKCARVIQEVFKTCVLSLNKRFFFEIFRNSGMRGFSKMRGIY